MGTVSTTRPTADPLHGVGVRGLKTSRYADQAAVDIHKSSPKLAWLIETEEKESNMQESIEVLPLEPFAGWAPQS